MADTRVSYAVNDVIGFCNSTKEMLNTNKAAMIAADVDPTALMAQLTTVAGTLTTENATQENMKTQLRDQTTLVANTNAAAYVKASKGCDMLISAFGRTSEQAKEATNLRKGLRPAKNKSTPTPPA